ncbi:hypothetical protein KRR39_05235 [Nocardioides panacis]|uniref:Uncharacterized protein n=1 Tax=Nocardioides panacis TaxID=2849501 RepID=A0A975T1L1_9ACTN|nr:hypothetical protein [Nocardioides panacis]QWZ09198.1 hypothetical protein KRR39_05235 [Nocardioides panacis]
MSENTLDPADFVGEPPAGDAHPGDFMSNDQSDPAAVAEDPAGTADTGDES